MKTFHGTSAISASHLVSGAVDVSRGGGELGQGFYTGEFLHEAKTWAFHVSGDRVRNVVSFSTSDDLILDLDLLILDSIKATALRRVVRNNGQTRTYRSFKDMVWAPIVGTARVSGEQYKWESKRTESMLNGSSTYRSIV